jgi:hypothetical protein
MEEMLSAAQRAGTVRADVGGPEVKALMTVCKSTDRYGESIAERVADIICDGLRSAR